MKSISEPNNKQYRSVFQLTAINYEKNAGNMALYDNFVHIMIKLIQPKVFTEYK